MGSLSNRHSDLTPTVTMLKKSRNPDDELLLHMRQKFVTGVWTFCSVEHEDAVDRTPEAFQKLAGG